MARRDAEPTAFPKREIGNLFTYGSLLKERNIPDGDGLPDLYNEVRVSGYVYLVLISRVLLGAHMLRTILRPVLKLNNHQHQILTTLQNPTSSCPEIGFNALMGLGKLSPSSSLLKA